MVLLSWSTLAGPGKAGSVPHWTLHKETWPQPSQDSCHLPPSILGSDGHTLHHELRRTDPDGIRGLTLAPLQCRVATVIWSDKPSFHPGLHLGFGLVHANIYSIWDLLGHVKGLVLWNDASRISMTSVVCGITQRSFSEDSTEECTKTQRPWTRSMSHWNEHFLVKWIG